MSLWNQKNYSCLDWQLHW